jgi:uncharacterized Tic20 family protein
MSESPSEWGAEVAKDERTLGLIVHLLIFTPAAGWGPLVLYIVKKDSSRFVGYHALQATILQVLSIYIFGVTLVGAIVGMVLAVMWALKANDGRWEGYPLIEKAGRP